MIHSEERRTRLQAMGASLAVHAVIFAALFHALDAVPRVIAPEQKTIAVSLADYRPAGGQPEAAGAGSRPKPVKTRPAKPLPKPVKKSAIPAELPPKQATEKPAEAESVTHVRPVPSPLPESPSRKTPEVKAPLQTAAPLSEVLDTPPSQTVTSAAPAYSPLTPGTARRGPMPSVPSAADPAQPGATVLGRIRAMIENAITYPAVARRLRLEGVVTVSFMLTPDGAVAGAEVIHSSGSAVLDRKALDTLWELSGDFPALKSLTQLTIPITFTLTKA